MQQYLDLVRRARNDGAVKGDRTEQEQGVFLGTKCALTYLRVFR
jgi:hypothetical protein